MSHSSMRGQVWLPRLVGAAILVSLLACLELFIRIGRISPFLVPPPSEVAAKFPMLILHEALLSRLASTFGETLAAASLAVVVGVFSGWVLNRKPVAHAAYLGWVVVIGAAPVSLLYPLFLVAFGRGQATVIAIAFISAVPAVVLKTCEGLSTTRRVLLDVGRSFRTTAAQQFWKIQLPAAVPSIFTGVRLGVIYSLLSVVGLEYLIDFGGLGQLVADLADRYEMAALYATILFIVLINVTFFISLEKVQNWLRPV
jgi:NitT/TauT family transport system permease protein